MIMVFKCEPKDMDKIDQFYFVFCPALVIVYPATPSLI